MGDRLGSHRTARFRHAGYRSVTSAATRTDQETPVEIALSKQDVAFAERMRTFYTSQIPETIRAKGASGEQLQRDDYVTSQRILNEHALAVPHWPKEWGGQ